MKITKTNEPTLDGAQRQSTEIKHLNAEQLENFLRVVFEQGTARDHALFCSIYHWALRASEAADLKVSDINWQTRQGHIVGKKSGLTADLFIVTVKGKPYLDQEKALRRYFADRKKTNEISTFLFASPQGRRVGSRFHQPSLPEIFRSHQQGSRCPRSAADPGRRESCPRATPHVLHPGREHRHEHLRRGSDCASPLAELDHEVCPRLHAASVTGLGRQGLRSAPVKPRCQLRAPLVYWKRRARSVIGNTGL